MSVRRPRLLCSSDQDGTRSSALTGKRGLSARPPLGSPPREGQAWLAAGAHGARGRRPVPACGLSPPSSLLLHPEHPPGPRVHPASPHYQPPTQGGLTPWLEAMSPCI